MTLREERTAHMRVTVRALPEGSKGSCFWAAPSRAREVISGQKAELLNDIPTPETTGILARAAAWPLDRFSHVLPLWTGKPAVILGGGPSLTREQFSLVAEARAADRVRVVAVNDAYLLAPWADVNYFADSEWWTWQIEGRAKPLLGLSAADVRRMFAAFPGEKCSIQNSGMNVTDPHVHLLRNLHGKVHGFGLSREPSMLVQGGHSGFQSINLAYLAGSRTIILCGFDAREPPLRKLGEHSHWFGEHCRLEPSAIYPLIRDSFRQSQHEFRAAGLRVINAAMSSAIETFPKMELRNALALE